GDQVQALATSVSVASFPSKIATVTEPTNDGVINVGWQSDTRADGTVPQTLLVLPYALAANNDTFDLRVIGWRPAGPLGPQSTPLWVPYILAGVSCTACAATGVAGAPVLNTERFCDTIAVTANYEPSFTQGAGKAGSITIQSPTDDTVGWFKIYLD